MATVAPLAGMVVLDVGCGTGFHLPRFHARARHVIGVEPYGPSRLRAMARVAALGFERASVLMGAAAALPLADASVDIAHARFAYFFGPGCEPGLAELARVMRRGGTAFVVDNDLQSGTFASWLRRHPDWEGADATTLDDFWTAQDFASRLVESEWRFESRVDLEAVVRLEFPSDSAEQILAEHPGVAVDYHYRLRYRHY
ncbi:MAG: class I SAM-dependent methyltransferase [Chloroflexia bacterium]|nr:class I SAM-dependent methyltransferase [Chloroflexia bacterium]